MNAPDVNVLQKVMQWLSYADDDLRLAQHALATMNSGCPYRLIAYHAHQCAEKCLKAYLVYHGIDFPYTHDISKLLELCSEKASWAETIQDAEELTLYAIITRYPGEGEEVTKEEAHRAIHIADNVRQVVRAAFTEEGVDLLIVTM